MVKGRRVEETLRKTWPKYAEMGVKVVGGSDGCGPGIGRRPGDGALELQLMVDYGMTPMQAIVCNTKNVADAMRMSDQIGTLEAGKFADLIVVDGDPLADIKILQDRKTSPPFITIWSFFRSCKILMSARGSPSTTMRSANFPASKVPIWSDILMASATFLVLHTMACIGVMP